VRAQGPVSPQDSVPRDAPTALELIETARETSWARPTVAGQLFLGRVLTHLLIPYTVQPEEDRRLGDAYLTQLAAFLKAHIDPEAVDRTGELPAEAIHGLARLGAFGMKIPKEYGGLGFSQVNYNRAIALIASYCGSTAVWLSAHQSIGVPQPLKLFGTEQQKRQYLPRLAAGAISAFALTELDVGSDPARMSTTATPVDGGAYYLLNGRKLWCTNGPVADLLVVMARTPDRVIGGRSRQQITAFIVERTMPGIEVVHRCEFMGLKGIQNGLLSFTDVKVPKENMLWGLGRGLKLAFVTLNTGRLTLPAACVGAAKLCLRIARRWSRERQQWGGPIGGHEAIAAKLSWMASHLFAMEAVTWLTAAWADRGDLDIRIEAAMAKLFCSEASWAIVDHTLQIRGGRGYETAASLEARGEEPVPVDRIFRDMRINLIIEGTSEIMRLFIAREALDPHIQLGFGVILPGRRLRHRLRAAMAATGFYAWWYPRQWLPRVGSSPSAIPRRLRGHWAFIEATSRRLARTLFHQALRYGPGLEHRQLILFYLVDVGVALYAMAASISRAAWLARQPGSENAVDLADLFCQHARDRIAGAFGSLGAVGDRRSAHVAHGLLKADYAWLEVGIMA